MECNVTGGLANDTLGGCDQVNKTLEELLTLSLGGRYRTLTESVILSIAYCFIFVTGVVGNVCTCIVIIKNNYMHTATNYYLFSLAISDVLTLILGLPPELYTVWEAYPWRLGEPYCLFKTFLTEMTSCASILTITAFTVERYVAICHPIRAQRMSSLSRAIKIIAVIWLSACTVSLPYPIHTRTYHYVIHPNTGIPIADSLICNIPSYWMSNMLAIFQLSTFLLFVLPMSIISVLYILIGITLRHSGLARQASHTSNSPPSQSRRAVLKMLVAVVVAFFICWAPFHAQRLMTVYVRDNQWTTTLLEIQSVLFYISGVLYFVSSTVNPILYNLMSRKYRQAFKETLCRCCLTEAERYPARDGRSRYLNERSTYTTFTASRTHPGQSHSLGHKAGNSKKTPEHISKCSDNGCARNNNSSSSNRWTLWKKRFFKRKRESVRGFSSPPLNGTRAAASPRGEGVVVARGGGASDGSRSASSSPALLAAHIKEEMEMDSMLQRNVVYPLIGDAGQGTML